jgi:hypothetical protein
MHAYTYADIVILLLTASDYCVHTDGMDDKSAIF